MHVNKYSGETSSYGSRHQRMSGHVPGALAQAAASARTGGAGVQRARAVWQHRRVYQRQVLHVPAGTRRVRVQSVDVPVHFVQQRAPRIQKDCWHAGRRYEIQDYIRPSAKTGVSF